MWFSVVGIPDISEVERQKILCLLSLKQIQIKKFFEQQLVQHRRCHPTPYRFDIGHLLISKIYRFY